MPTETFLFAAGIILGAVIGYLGNLAVESYYQGFNVKEKTARILFVIGLGGMLFLVLGSYLWIFLPALTDEHVYNENCTCSCVNYTYNYAFYNISNISVESKSSFPSINDTIKILNYHSQKSALFFNP